MSQECERLEEIAEIREDIARMLDIRHEFPSLTSLTTRKIERLSKRLKELENEYRNGTKH